MTKKTAVKSSLATHKDTFCLSLSSDLKRSLKQRSAIEDRPVCNILENAANEYLKKNK